MIKIDLEKYKYNKQYLLLFDILIKQNHQNKDIFLEDINITPSSYRRIKTSEQNLGENIINTLCGYFNISFISKSEIEKTQLFLNKIYYDYYYDVNDNCSYIVGKLNDLIEEKNLLYPLFILFKLLFLFTNNLGTSINNEKEFLYQEVLTYKSYYTEELIEIFKHIEILHDKDLNNKTNLLNSQNGLLYSSISIKLMNEEKYTESLYYATIAKQIFQNDENYKRIAYINFIIMTCYCNLRNYDKYYDLAYNQYFSMQTFEYNEIKEKAYKHYAISMIALEKYYELDYFYKNNNITTLTEVICLLITKFHLDYDLYNDYYIQVSQVLKDDNRVEILNIINQYLKTKNKKILRKIENKIDKNLFYILKH